jgi:hypothetical protein
MTWKSVNSISHDKDGRKLNAKENRNYKVLCTKGRGDQNGDGLRTWKVVSETQEDDCYEG